MTLTKINIKQFRQLYQFTDNNKEKEKSNIILLLAAGENFIDIHTESFAGYTINRKNIQELFKQCCNVDTLSWKYYTNDCGKVLLYI